MAPIFFELANVFFCWWFHHVNFTFSLTNIVFNYCQMFFCLWCKESYRKFIRNWSDFIKNSSEIHLKFIRNSSEIHLKFIWNSSEIHLKFIWNSSEIHQKFIWNSSEIHQKFARNSSEIHQPIQCSLNFSNFPANSKQSLIKLNIHGFFGFTSAFLYFLHWPTTELRSSCGYGHVVELRITSTHSGSISKISAKQFKLE